MRPLRVRSEIDGFVADRLLEALWREALWLVHDDIATVEEIDDAIRFGPGLRWAQMGTFLTYRIAGGEEGMHHFLEQFGPALEWPWTKLTDVPELTPELIDEDRVPVRRPGRRPVGARARAASRRQPRRAPAGPSRSPLRAPAPSSTSTKRGCSRLRLPTPAEDPTRPLRLYEGVVDPSWVDYNGHLTEARYLHVFAESTDALLGLVGVDADYLGRRTQCLHGRDAHPSPPRGGRTGADRRRHADPRDRREAAPRLPRDDAREKRRDPRDGRADAPARRRGRGAGERVAGAGRERESPRRRRHMPSSPVPEGAGRAIAMPPS